MGYKNIKLIPSAEHCGRFITSIVCNDRRVIVFPRDDTSELTDVLERSWKEHFGNNEEWHHWENIICTFLTSTHQFSYD